MNNLCTLPQKMLPTREAFEALGFTFAKPKNEALYWASLPSGWNFKVHIGSIDILDQNGQKRALYDYNHACMSIV